MLERVLRSETFSRSERSRDLLRYLVERELAGDRERLKGFNVAMDVFGKDTAFDPSTDAVVRVQAGRLRELLTQYYQGEGAADAVKIYIPRGGYVPSYRRECPNVLEELAETARLAQAGVKATPSASAAPPGWLSRLGSALRPSAERVERHIQMMWATLAVVVALLGLFALRLAAPGMPEGYAGIEVDGPVTASIRRDAVALDALPRVVVIADAASEPVAKAMRTGLAGFDMVSLLLRGSAAAEGEEPAQVDFAFDLTAGADGKSVSVVLSNTRSGRVLDERAVSLAEDAPLDDQVAALLSSTVPVAGVIYGDIAQNGHPQGLVQCLLLNDEFYLDQDEEKHRRAFDCMQDLAAADVRSTLVYSELASLHLKAVTDGYGYPPGASEDQAFVLARRAVKLGMNSPYAHRALGFLFGRTGNGAESVRWMRKAYELNGYDLTMAAAYGYALVFSGDYAGGEPIMTRAVEAASAHPTWWDYGLFVARFMLSDTAGAARAAAPLIGGKRQHYVAALAVVADAAGDKVRSAALLSDLARSYPKFAADPAGTLTLANYPADFVAKFSAALRAAGLGDAS